MPDFEIRLKALEAAHKELEDSFIVMTHLETKMGQALREQAEYMASHEQRLRQAELHNRDVDARIEKLVSAIGTLIASGKR